SSSIRLRLGAKLPRVSSLVFVCIRRPSISTLFPYTTLLRSFLCRRAWTHVCSRLFTCHKSPNPTFHSVPFAIWKKIVWSFLAPELDSHTSPQTPWRHNEL